MTTAVSGAEAAIHGPVSRAEIDAWVGRVLTRCGAGGLAEILFRSGRIDVVYGVVAADGRTVTVETLLDAGRPGSGHDPAVRRAVAAGLAGQILVLRAVDGLSTSTAPAWCRYQDGPWPVPHDTVFDFGTTPDGFAWLDALAARASTRLRAARTADEIVTGHADWYCGNLRFDGVRLVASFDWDLVSDAAPVIAGITAGGFTGGSTSGPEAPSPEDVTAFLSDFERAHGRAFTAEERRLAGAGAAWNMAYSARCDLAVLDGAPPTGSALEMLGRRGDELFDLRW